MHQQHKKIFLHSFTL